VNKLITSQWVPSHSPASSGMQTPKEITTETNTATQRTVENPPKRKMNKLRVNDNKRQKGSAYLSQFLTTSHRLDSSNQCFTRRFRRHRRLYRRNSRIDYYAAKAPRNLCAYRGSASTRSTIIWTARVRQNSASQRISGGK
jgi:hypothetical protein